MRNASATDPTPIEATTRSGKRNLRPNSPLMAAPNSGRRGTSQMYLCIGSQETGVRSQEREGTRRSCGRHSVHRLPTPDFLPFQEVNLVDEDRLAVAVERDDEAEADGRLGGGDD